MIEIIIVSVLLILLILITIQTRYKAPMSNNFEEHTMYFDDDYYDMPKLNIINDTKDFSRVSNETRYQPIIQKESNQQASRWAGSIESQHINNNSNIYDNTDTKILQSGFN